jgi:hypothetical protein
LNLQKRRWCCQPAGTFGGSKAGDLTEVEGSGTGSFSAPMGSEAELTLGASWPTR